MIKRIPVSALKVGIEKIRRMGLDYVYIDVSRGLDSQDSEPAQETDQRNEAALQRTREQKPAVFKQVTVAEEMVRAQQVHTHAQGLVGNLMNNVKFGTAIDIASIHQLADEFQSSVFRNANGLSCLGRIREKDNYLLEHSVNLSVLVAQAGGMENRT